MQSRKDQKEAIDGWGVKIQSQRRPEGKEVRSGEEIQRHRRPLGHRGRGGQRERK